MPEGAALSWSFSAVVVRRKGRLAFRYRVPGARYSTNGRNWRVPVVAGRSGEGLFAMLLQTSIIRTYALASRLRASWMEARVTRLFPEGRTGLHWP